MLRHTTAMRLLHAGVDTSVIALWLGHVSLDTTQIYLHADLNLKEKALARTRPPNGRAGRYQPPDSLITWLETLSLCRPRKPEIPTPQGFSVNIGIIQRSARAPYADVWQVHLIRASLRYASKKRYWTPLAKDLRAIYSAADETAAAAALEDFAAAGERYPAIIRLWRAHWPWSSPRSWRSRPRSGG